MALMVTTRHSSALHTRRMGWASSALPRAGPAVTLRVLPVGQDKAIQQRVMLVTPALPLREKRGGTSPLRRPTGRNASGSSKGGNKRARQDPADMLVASAPLGSVADGSPTVAGHDSLSERHSLAVKMETGLFEGKPCGSFQIRRRPGSR